jgi:SAM-dependent methyltransferase
MKQRYEDAELRELLAAVGERRGWDFSSMRPSVAPTPWEYSTVVRSNLRPSDRVLDVGTGGGERLVELAADFSYGLGVDPDLAMIATAQANADPT